MKTLYHYQKEALQFIIERKRSLLALDMGLGKTFVAVNWLHKIFNKFTFIVAQKNKVEDWKKETSLFFDNSIIFVPKTSNDLIDLILDKSANKAICITTYAKFRSALKTLKKTLYNTFEMFDIIIDESQVLKSPTSDLSKLTLLLEHIFENVLLCSGDPLSCGYKDLFVQMKLLKSFGKNYTWNNFKKDFCYTKTYNQVIEIIVGYKNIDELKKILNEKSFFMKTTEAIDLPSQNHIEIEIKTNKYFDNLLKNKCLLYDETNYLICDNSLKLLNSLRQLQSGFIYNEKRETIFLNDNKKEAFKELIDNNNSFVVFYNFKAELAQIENVVKSLNKNIVYFENYNPTENFENTIIPLQFQSGAKGIDGLQLNFNKCIYYSLPLSGELYKQSLKRIHRLNQQEKCFYYYLMNDNKLEKKIYKCLKLSEEYTQNMFEKDFEL